MQIIHRFPHSKSKLVDMSDWADIDKKRRARREKRTEKRRKGRSGQSKTARYNPILQTVIDCHLRLSLCNVCALKSWNPNAKIMLNPFYAMHWSNLFSLGSDGDQGEDELDCQHQSSAPFLPRYRTKSINPFASCSASLSKQQTSIKDKMQIFYKICCMAGGNVSCGQASLSGSSLSLGLSTTLFVFTFIDIH